MYQLVPLDKHTRNLATRLGNLTITYYRLCSVLGQPLFAFSRKVEWCIEFDDMNYVWIVPKHPANFSRCIDWEVFGFAFDNYARLKDILGFKHD